jgi:hypothetical protein
MAWQPGWPWPNGHRAGPAQPAAGARPGHAVAWYGMGGGSSPAMGRGEGLPQGALGGATHLPGKERRAAGQRSGVATWRMISSVLTLGSRWSRGAQWPVVGQELHRCRDLPPDLRMKTSGS